MDFHNSSLKIIIGIITAIAALTILQIWNIGFGWEIYTKIVVTLGLIAGVMALIMVLKADLGNNKDLKDKNYLD